MSHNLTPVTLAPDASTPRTAFAWAERTALFGELPPADALPALTRRVSPPWSTVAVGYGQPNMEVASVDAWKNARAVATKELVSGNTILTLVLMASQLHHTLFHALREVHSPEPDIPTLRSLLETAWEYEMGIMTSLGRRNLAGGSTKFPLLGVPLDPTFFVGKQFELREKEFTTRTRTTARKRTRAYADGDATDATTPKAKRTQRSKRTNRAKGGGKGKSDRRGTPSTSGMDIDSLSRRSALSSESSAETDSSDSSTTSTTETGMHNRSQSGPRLQRTQRTYARQRGLTVRKDEDGNDSDSDDSSESEDSEDDSKGAGTNGKGNGRGRKRARYASRRG